ncbi:hypothetical protein Slala03_25100 [Streptomyces lavendulae subsp. lavendulae]|uniref:hypothetical protein n=1 Tax=Streptomyces lavendulae TaxID=1914 RepID=UPI0024A3C73C|nr:hypothetical protein [Streptomyces lavendulae]GLV82821.1 hypothetical protein Slala03_25100 [Streptomyces lavendulae subsp. lavendulae]
MTPAGRSPGGKAGKAARLVRVRPAATTAGQAARMPFVLLVVALLGGGLISLLLLNSALNQGSFQLTKLKKETTALTDEQQALQRDVDAYSAPDALQRRAHELGLVPGGSPVFIGSDGKVAGTPAQAEAPPAPSPPVVSPSAQPPASGAPAPPSGGPAPATGQPAPPQAQPQPSQTPGR